MSGIMSGHVGAMEKKGPPSPYVKGGILHPTASFLGKQYVISPKAFGQAQKAWASTYTLTNVMGQTTGMANSNTLASYGSTAFPAAYFCRALSGSSAGGYSDWYLPASLELHHIYSAKTYLDNLNIYGSVGFEQFETSPMSWYWASTDCYTNPNNNGKYYAYIVDFNTGWGSPEFMGKDNANGRVRAIRSY